jgi:c-di-GMP-binding flagellar brake protein YcgR
VHAQGEIVRITQTENGAKEYGVKFFGISPSVESKIETFIRTWLKRTKRHR